MNLINGISIVDYVQLYLNEAFHPLYKEFYPTYLSNRNGYHYLYDDEKNRIDEGIKFIENIHNKIVLNT